jgi:hypothetical protein
MKWWTSVSVALLLASTASSEDDQRGLSAASLSTVIAALEEQVLALESTVKEQHAVIQV